MLYDGHVPKLGTEKSAVTTNCKKSAEVVVPEETQGRTEQFKTSIVMYVPSVTLT